MGRLVLVPVGETEAPFLDALEARIVPGLPVEPVVRGECLDSDAFHDSARNQVHSTALLGALSGLAPARGDRVLGVATRDLFIPILTFVFGEAELGGCAAVFSTARLDPAFYGLPSDPGLILDRAVKEARHELGHTFGLIHCRDMDCVMRASTDVGEVDVKSAGFCRECRRQLRRSS